MTRLFLACLAALTLFACGSDSSFTTADIESGTPMGVIAGAPFEYAGAVIELRGSELDITLYESEVEDPCSVFGLPDGNVVLFNVPATVGEYPLNFDFSGDTQTVTLVEAPANNLIATEGIIDVEAMSDTEATIGLIAQSGDSYVNGRFTASICPN